MRIQYIKPEYKHTDLKIKKLFEDDVREAAKRECKSWIGTHPWNKYSKRYTIVINKKFKQAKNKYLLNSVKFMYEEKDDLLISRIFISGWK